jgi:hypothetical protein
LYSNIIRSDEYIEKLLDFVRSEYGIDAIGIYPAKRGFYAETWKLKTADCSYFIKVVYPVTHKSVYKKSFLVIDHMNRHGIDFISRIVKTTQGNLSVYFNDAVLGVFDWIDGENREDEKTKIREYKMLAKIYTVPTEDLIIQRENFSADSADTFFQQCSTLSSDTPLYTLFEQHRKKIEHRAKRLRLFSERCCNDVSSFVITHGDAGGNYIASNGIDYIVDWDMPILAPPERDAWFCMHWDWAMEGFHNALQQNGLGYTLRQERLAYYCYHMFFFYLNAYIDRYTQIGITEGIEEYMSGWLEDAFEFAGKFI